MNNSHTCNDNYNIISNVMEITMMIMTVATTTTMNLMYQ